MVGEKKITCRKCKTKFPIKVGSKNNGCIKKVNCPNCRMENIFRVDEKGKVHGPRV